MKQLSSQARDHLAALRSADSPATDASARVWDGVQTRAAAGDLGPDLPAEPSAATGAAAGTSIKSIALGVFVGASIAAATAVLAMDRDDASARVATPALAGLRDVVPPQAPVTDPVIAPVIAPPIEPVIEPPSAPMIEPVEDTAIEPEPVEVPEQPAAIAPVRPRPAPRAEPKPETDGIAQEVALLSEARSALGAGEAKRALGVLARHAKRFPNGVLARERDVSWITALCVLGRVDQARAKADVFLRAHGSSPHAAKVRASCGGSSE